MDLLDDDMLLDPAYRVPEVDAGAGEGLGWLRAHVPRFCDGPDHARRRTVVEEVLATLADAPFRTDPTTSLLLASGLDPDLAADVATVAAAYQPHTPQTAAADAAADRLVAACGGRTERSAARVCVLVQGHAATAALVAVRARGDDRPPVPTTCRVAPSGEVVEVDLTGAWFGRGPHACPGRALAERLAGATRTADL